MWDVFMRVRVCTCTFTYMLWYVLYTYICMSLYERELIETFHWSNTWWLVTSYAKYYTDDDVMKALKTDKRLQYGGHLLFFGTIIKFFFLISFVLTCDIDGARFHFTHVKYLPSHKNECRYSSSLFTVPYSNCTDSVKPGLGRSPACVLVFSSGRPHHPKSYQQRYLSPTLPAPPCSRASDDSAVASWSRPEQWQRGDTAPLSKTNNR